MADIGTLMRPSQQGREIPPSGGEGRRVERVRRLPSGRAVVGALLVTTAAVATFAAYLGATAEPTTAYLVATGPIEAGTRLESREAVTERFGSVAVDLTSPLDERAIPVDELGSLVGHVVVAPLDHGELATRSAVVDDGGVSSAQTVSFAVPRDDAVGGSLRAGQRIDVLATYGANDGAYTAYVLRGVPVLSVAAPDGGTLETAPDLMLTVAISDLVDVQSLGHAVNTADVLVTRSTADPGDADEAPGPFRADPDAPGPRPEPADPAPGPASSAGSEAPAEDQP